MSIWLHFFLFAVGIVLIVKGGDFFVDSASYIAEISGIPKFIVGATIVSLATTMPEMLVSLMASFQGAALGDTPQAAGKYSMAVGNAIGSVTANTGLILSIAILFMTIAVSRKKYLVKSLLLIASVTTVWLGSLSGKLSLIASLILLAIFAVFVYENIKSAKADLTGSEERPEFVKKDFIVKIVLFFVGAVMLVVGSNLLVNHGTPIAQFLHVPDGIIAVTMIAIGTSLPELVTTITAIVKKQSSLSAGNIIGANIIDLTLILPLSSLVSGGRLTIDSQGLTYDMPACLTVILLAVLPMIITEKFRKWQGVAMLIAYAVYLFLIVRAGAGTVA